MLHFAYRMLQEKANPSWLYPVSMGATTIWERRDSMLPDGSIYPGQMTSFNHYALGSVANFLHTVVGGLSSLEAGWKRALIAPTPGGTITHAKTSHISPHGLYESSWQIFQGKLRLKTRVPPNASAEIELPGLSKTVGSRVHEFEVDWVPDERWLSKGLQLPCTPAMIDNFV
jgi:alpha-L-rhamnosidase